MSAETRQRMSVKAKASAAAGRSPVTRAGWKHSDEARAKMLAWHASHPRSGSKNPFFGKKHTEETKARVAAVRAKGPILPTTPERAVHKELRQRGIRFLSEHQIGVYCVDVFVPAFKLAIFIDGCYWHACPLHHPTRKKPGSDNARIPYLSKGGYKVAILWEHEIEDDVSKAVSSIFGGLLNTLWYHK